MTSDRRPGQTSYDLAIRAAWDAEDRAAALRAEGDLKSASFAENDAKRHRLRAEDIRHAFNLPYADEPK